MNEGSNLTLVEIKQQDIYYSYADEENQCSKCLMLLNLHFEM
jgi:hypothetical protein